MNHEKEQKAPHHSEQKCSYEAQYDNKVYTCKVNKSFLLIFANKKKDDLLRFCEDLFYSS